MSTEPLRVLLIINSLGAGGAERSMIEMIPALAKHHIHVEVATLKDDVEGVSDLLMKGTRHTNLAGSSMTSTIISLRRHLRYVKPDIVHTTLFQADVLGRIASIGTGIQVLSSLVNMGYQPIRLDDPNVRRARLATVRAIDAFTARRLTDGFHALTHAAAGEAVRVLKISPESITVVPRGRRPERWDIDPTRASVLRPELGVSPSQPVVLAVGRHEFQKDHVSLIRAMDQVSRQLPDAILLIAGREGNATDDIRNALAGVAADIRLLGHRTDVPELMSMADVLVFPSLYEGFGGVVIEAMASGLPIICSDLPPLREVAGHAARYTPVRDPESLGKQIVELLTEPDVAASLAQRGRERFLSLYTLDRVAERMALLYRSVAGR